MAKYPPPRRPSQTPGRGIEVDPEVTPPPVDLEELVIRLWPLRHLEGRIVELETRLQFVERDSESTSQEISIDAVEKEIRCLAADIVDIKGTSGTNGKIGAVRAEVTHLTARIEKQEARRWTLIVTAVGMILTAASLAVAGGRWVGKLENRVEQLEKYTPGKELK